jgi:hypothetical protein
MAGRFRSDLCYRLKVLSLRSPSARAKEAIQCWRSGCSTRSPATPASRPGA